MTSINNGVKYRGCDFADDLLKPNIRNWLNKNNFKNTLNVPIRRKGMTGSGYKYQCHQNVFNLVNAYGGNRLGGYAVCIDDDADAVVAIAKVAGFVISAEELARAREEVSEEELESVAGGKGTQPSLCPDWCG